jgi:RNA polymerase-binding protein DksA
MVGAATGLCYLPGPMSPAKKSSARSSKTTARKQVKKSTAKKTTARKPVKKTTAKKSASKKTAAPKPVKKTAAKKSLSKKTPARNPVKKTTAKKSAERTGGRSGAGKAPDDRARAATAPVRTPRKVRAAKLDKKALQQIRATLEAERAALEKRQAELEQDSFDGTQSEITGEVGLDEDFADAGTATFERERDLSIRNNIRDLIDQITRALRRITEGTYGSCERCGRPIDAARLKALPHALLCMDCKRREERAR